MDEDGGVVLWGGLEAELGICGARVVSEGNTRGQLAIIQQGLVMICKQQVTLGLVLEHALRRRQRRLVGESSHWGEKYRAGQTQWYHTRV